MTTPRTTARPGGLRAVILAAVVALAALLSGVAAAAPAAAHSGGAALVLVRNFTVAPVADKWMATVTLGDFDSAEPIIGADVRIIEGATEPTTTKMAESKTTPGVYTATLVDATEGANTIALKVRTLPGGLAVNAFDKTWEPVLVADQETIVTAAAGGGGGGSNTGMIISVAGAVLLVALLYGLFSVRRRTAVPARAK